MWAQMVEWWANFQAWRWARRERLPSILRHAELVLSESSIETLYPVPLCGRVDQAFRLDGGRGAVVLMDTKTRRWPVVSEAERVQLSVYRVILEHNPPPHLAGVPLAGYALVRFKGRNSAADYRRCDLLTTAQVVAEYRMRRQELS